jgi:hypothetical protein
MSDTHVLVTSTGSTNPIKVELDGSHHARKLYLTEYIFKGVPVTSGIPDSPIYSLVFENSQFQPNKISRTDRLSGIPLGLDTGTYTHHRVNPPIEIADFGGDSNNTRNLHNAHIRVVDQNNNNAIYTDAIFWFYFK